ncbi:MAG TPA: peptidoglycan recognition family protein [Actinomycetota bacterium]
MVRRLSRRRFLAGGLGSLLSGLRPLSGLAAAPKRVDVICRRAWRAAPPREGLRRHRIRRLTVHHSAVVLSDNRDAPGRFRGHQRAHFGNGWPDIAYHVLIDRGGNVYRGRSPRFRGDTATDYDPKGHLLVLCEGDFDRQPLSGRQVTALVDVLAWACRRFDVKPSTIRGHGDWASTACPGRRLRRKIRSGRIRARVRERLRRGGVELQVLCGDAGRRRVRRIERGRA